MIGVPRAAVDAVLTGGDFGIADFKNFWMAGGAHVLVVLRQQRAENFACSGKLCSRHFLIVKDQHVMFGEVGIDFLL